MFCVFTVSLTRQLHPKTHPSRFQKQERGYMNFRKMTKRKKKWCKIWYRKRIWRNFDFHLSRKLHLFPNSSLAFFNKKLSTSVRWPNEKMDAKLGVPNFFDESLFRWNCHDKLGRELASGGRQASRTTTGQGGPRRISPGKRKKKGPRREFLNKLYLSRPTQAASRVKSLDQNQVTNVPLNFLLGE